MPDPTPTPIPLSERTAPRPVKLSIPASIVWWVEKHDIPLSRLAEHAGVDRAQLSHWLKGHTTVRTDFAEKVLHALGLGISFNRQWTPPAALQRDVPGPEPKPKKKRRTRPNNKPL